MLLWGLLLIVARSTWARWRPAGRRQRLAHAVEGPRRGVAVYGALFLIGVAAGGRDTLQPLRGVVVGGAAGADRRHMRLQAHQDDRRSGPRARRGQGGRQTRHARLLRRLVCVLQADGDATPSPIPRCSERWPSMVLLQADVTDQDDADKALQGHIGIPAPPAMIFWGADGAERKHLRLLGFMGPERVRTTCQARSCSEDPQLLPDRRRRRSARRAIAVSRGVR